MSRFRGLVAALLALVSAAPAQAEGFGVELLGAHANEQWGGELGLGYQLDVGPFAIRPIVGAFVFEGENDRYYRDTFSNGQSRCRDSTNGQFANDSNCVNIDAKIYGKAELVYISRSGFEIGGGGRVASGDKIRPYGTLAVSLSPRFRVKGNAGDSYYAAGVSFGF